MAFNCGHCKRLVGDEEEQSIPFGPVQSDDGVLFCPDCEFKMDRGWTVDDLLRLTPEQIAELDALVDRK